MPFATGICFRATPRRVARRAGVVCESAVCVKASLEMEAARMRYERTEHLRRNLWRHLTRQHRSGSITLDELKNAKAAFWLRVSDDAAAARLARRLA